jgi:UDP-N-acetyl-2-amino-2-deoxyglucuronate dehydrogenase
MPTDQNRFALIGAAGYIAPRHLRAIRDNGGDLLAAFDPADSVGILDSYFPNTSYFSEFERFDRHVEKLRRKGDGIDYVAICSPNYLHDAHIRFALRSGAHAICEKPLVLNPWNVDALEELEADGDRKIFTILQLRLHPAVIALRDRVAAEPGKIWDVDLTYITSRGGWYHVSWKGDEKKSGGIATNIGVHFYDMLSFVFGPLQENVVHLRDANRASGYLGYERARVRWYLSIDRGDLPAGLPDGQPTYRSIKVGDDEIEFSAGFTDLHTLSYEHILAGKGFGIAEVRPSIETVARIRNMELTPPGDLAHPFLRKRLGA